MENNSISSPICNRLIILSVRNFFLILGITEVIIIKLKSFTLELDRLVSEARKMLTISKLPLMVRLQFWGDPLLPSFRGKLRPRVVVPVKVTSIGQIDVNENHLYLIGILKTIQNCATYLYLIEIFGII